MAAAGIPVVHMSVAGTAVLGTTVVQHTVASVAGTVAVAVVDKQLLHVEDKPSEAAENRTALDRASGLEPVVHTVAAVLKLQNKTTKMHQTFKRKQSKDAADLKQWI